MMRSKTIIGIGIAAVVLLIGGIIIAMLANQSPTQDTTTSDAAAEAPPSLYIENFFSYPNITNGVREGITSSIQRYLGNEPENTTLTGVIRDGSYKETSDGTISNMSFLVDIESVQRTYKISYGTDTSTGEGSLYTLCPTKDELRYPPFDCKDDISETK
jgi:hypothetical protein